MNGAKSYVIRALLGAALASGGLPGLAAAFPPPPPPTPTPTPVPTPTPTPRYELSLASGKASKVGVVPTPGQSGDSIVKITGRFTHAGEIPLSPSRQVTLGSLLNEYKAGGAGELVEELQGGPITLNFKSSGNKSAIFSAPDQSRPSARLSLQRKPGGIYLVNLSVKQAKIPNDPTLCAGSPPTTTLATEFVIEDVPCDPSLACPSPAPAVTVAGTAEWKCVLDQDKLRIPTGSGDGGGNAAPKASVRTQLLDPDTGIVLLDGSNSSDADGTIVSYAFSVETKPGGVAVFDPLAGPAPSVTTPPLPPGDYTAILVVTDNLGTPSAPGTRSLSIK